MIPIYFALITSKTDGTNAFVSVDQISTFATVLTWFRSAFVYIDVAIFSRITSGTGTMIVVDEIDAQRSVLTLTDAIVDVFRTIFTGKTASAATSI